MEMPQRRKSTKTGDVDSLRCLEKPRKKHARLSHISTGTAADFKKGGLQRKNRFYLTEVIHFGNSINSQRRFAPTSGCFPRNRWLL
jgi:hypothetical protein